LGEISENPLFRSTVRPIFVLPREWLVGLVERRDHIRTSGVIELDEIGLAGPDRARYKPAPWFTLRRSLPPSSVSAEDVFIDLGCGMGRIVFQAALSYPLQRAIRVELSPALHTIPQPTWEESGSPPLHRRPGGVQ